MKVLLIGQRIASKRKERGITQEELAQFLGVSKPAVSKWESGQSYPDITLLPPLATFFNTTVDELLCYEPQMSGSDIQKLYHRLAADFNSRPFHEVYQECLEYLRKYYSCWALQFSMGLLLINHINLAANPEKITEVIDKAMEIFRRIIQESANVNLSKQALSMEAVCLMSLGKPAEAIDLLDDEPEIHMDTELLLSRAYAMKGDFKRARSYIQRYLYQCVLGVISACPDYIYAYQKEPERVSKGVLKALELAYLYGINEMHPAVILPVYLLMAQTQCAGGKTEEALDWLEKYTNLALSADFFPLRLKGSAFFDSMEEFFETLSLGTHAPRSDESVRLSIREALTSNPVFEPLQTQPRFTLLLRRLDAIFN